MDAMVRAEIISFLSTWHRGPSVLSVLPARRVSRGFRATRDRRGTLAFCSLRGISISPPSRRTPPTFLGSGLGN